jgi:hypothetical protein
MKTVVLGPEAKSALNALNRQFGKDLYLAKFDTCCAAFEGLKGLSVGHEKRAALDKHFREWKAASAAAVRKWVPKYVALAVSAGIGKENKWMWVDDRVTQKLRTTCIGRGLSTLWARLPLRVHDRPMTTWEPIEWWIRNACHEAVYFGILRSEPWAVPDWLFQGTSSACDPIGYYQAILQGELLRELSYALDLAKIDSTTGSATDNLRPVKMAASPRRTTVDAFIARVLAETGQKISRKSIWVVAGYKARSEFERFERGDKRATQAATKCFDDILELGSGAFLERLNRRQSK